MHARDAPLAGALSLRPVTLCKELWCIGYACCPGFILVGEGQGSSHSPGYCARFAVACCHTRERVEKGHLLSPSHALLRYAIEGLRQIEKKSRAILKIVMIASNCKFVISFQKIQTLGVQSETRAARDTQ